MRNAVKTMSRLAKEKSRTAYREVRSKIKDMHGAREIDGASFNTSPTKGGLHDKPRSAPSSPKFNGSGKGSLASQRKSGVPPSALTRQLSSSVIDRSLRRCETSVSQHYVSDANPGFPSPFACQASSSDESGSEDELNMAPLNLDLMDDLKDILAKSAAMSSTPPVVDRSVKPSFFFCVEVFVHREVSVFVFAA